jgi:predicted DNA-binding transcriptional regulator AlpA
MNNAETKLWKLFFESEREITRLEEENTFLKEKMKQSEEQRITKSSPVRERKDWVELESGKRFLTKKELAKYLGISAGTISNQISIGTFPIRVKKMGKNGLNRKRRDQSERSIFRPWSLKPLQSGS